jgi:hypothetical protein
MPQRFHTTSTNRILQLAQPQNTPELKDLLQTDRQIKRLIQDFNLAVEASFTAGGMQGLKNLCTPAGFVHMQEKYAGWKSQSIAALHLITCNFLSFDWDAQKNFARAFTQEQWGFTYTDGKEIPNHESVDEYEIDCIDGQWLVDSVRSYALPSTPA